MKKKIAIVGTAPSKAQAPYGDKDWEIWGCNRSCFDLERWDCLFEIHRKWDMDQSLWDHDHVEYFEDLKKVKPPQQVISTLPIGDWSFKVTSDAEVKLHGVTRGANLVMNRDALFEKYGTIWFSSSLAYMLAWALEQKPEEIGIWGVEMESHEEYVVQFAGCRHFIDLARALGIKVTTPDGCLLMREVQPYPDRFETTPALAYEVKARQIRQLMEKNKRLMWGLIAIYLEREDMATINEMREAIARQRGMLIAIQHFKRMFVWNVLPPDDEDEHDCGPI